MGHLISKDGISIFLKKYKFVVLVFVLGLLLMFIPSGKKDFSPNTDIISVDDSILTIEEQLRTILSYVKGAGDVQVMLSQANGSETLYQMNEDSSITNENNSVRTDTVTVTDADHNEKGLIRQVNPPIYKGAIIVCQGADSPSVRLAIIEAVSKITGLGTDKISVLKMK